MTDHEVSGEDAIIQRFRENTYNAQSSVHILAIRELVLKDLVASSEVVRSVAENGELVYSSNYPIEGPEFLDDIG